MPIHFHIDHNRRLVVASAIGHLTGREMFDYQRAAWSRPDVAGFHELIDMTRVEQIEKPTAEGMRELAALSASMDVPAMVTQSGKFAIVAPQQLVYGLGRMYEAYRGLQPGSTKEVGVFRTLGEAAVFLGVRLLASSVELPTQTKEEGAT